MALQASRFRAIMLIKGVHSARTRQEKQRPLHVKNAVEQVQWNPVAGDLTIEQGLLATHYGARQCKRLLSAVQINSMQLLSPLAACTLG